MHLVIAPAGPLAGLPAEARAALEALLASAELLSAAPLDPLDLHTPTERLLGRLRGLPDSAALPLAAWRLDERLLHWAFISPIHLQLEANRALALHPAQLQLSDADSHTLFELLAPLFPADEGWERAWLDAQTWAVAHPQLQGLRLASVERAVDRPLTPWLPQERTIRRWTNEAQMLLHAQPLNAAREREGKLRVNSIWWWGAGRHAGEELPAGLQIDERLHAPLLAQDLPQLAAAWRVLADELPKPGSPPWLLSLAGEQGLATLQIGERPWWQRLLRRGPRLDDLFAGL